MTFVINIVQMSDCYFPTLRVILRRQQEPRGHPTSASNVAWMIVNYSSTRVSWLLLALCDLEEWILVLRYSENNVTVDLGQLYFADTFSFLKTIPIPNLVVMA